MTLGLVVIGWNACEGALKDILITLTLRNVPEHRMLVTPVIAELGTLGVVQALQCIAEEFPDEDSELRDELRYLVKVSETLKAFRNYYVHGVRSVTEKGIFVDEVPLERMSDPFSEIVVQGPFAQIFQQTAKGSPKVHYDFIKTEQLAMLCNQQGELKEYATKLEASIKLYLRGLEWRKLSPLPPRPPMPDRLVKREVPHRKRLLAPALTPNPRPELEDED